MKHEITNEQPFAWFLRVWQGRLINQLERERERTSECNVVSVRVKRGRNVPRRVSSPVSSKSLCLSWIQFSLPLSLSRTVQFDRFTGKFPSVRPPEIPLHPSPLSKGIERASSSFEWKIDGWKEDGDSISLRN